MLCYDVYLVFLGDNINIIRKSGKHVSKALGDTVRTDNQSSKCKALNAFMIFGKF